MTARQRDDPPGDAGFTLLEVIVVLLLLGLVLGLVGSGAQLLRGTGDRLAGRSAMLADVTLVVGLLQDRLGDAVLLDIGPAGRPVASFDGTADRARFLTIAAEFAGGEPLVAMEVGGDAGGGLAIVLAEHVAGDRGFAPLDDATRAERRRLLAEASDVRLAYFGRKEGARDAAWHDAWQGEPRLPRAVRLSIDHVRLELPPLIVPVRQDLATLCPSAVAEQPCFAP